MSILRPYQLWLSSIRHLLHRSESFRRGLLSPLYEMDLECKFGGHENLQARNLLVRQLNDDWDSLSKAKRFVVPDNINSEPGHMTIYTGTEDAKSHIRRLYDNNPYPPYPMMYLQVSHGTLFETGGLKREDLWSSDGRSTISFWTFLIQHINGGYLIRVGAMREHKDHGPAFDFMPILLCYGRENTEDEPKFTAFIYSGFKHKDTLNTTAVMTALYEIFVSFSLNTIDLINHYPIEYKKAEGLREISPKTKVKAFTKIAHSIIHLGRPYYEYVAEEKEERDRVHMREHDVRGHWRHYQNGRQTWIKHHKRGDPALGTVDSEYDLK